MCNAQFRNCAAYPHRDHMYGNCIKTFEKKNANPKNCCNYHNLFNFFSLSLSFYLHLHLQQRNEDLFYSVDWIDFGMRLFRFRFRSFNSHNLFIFFFLISMSIYWIWFVCICFTLPSPLLYPPKTCNFWFNA